MAPNFVSPGAMAARSIEEFFLQRAAEERQAEQDAMAREREARLLKSTDANIANTQANTAALGDQRAANVALAQEKLKAERDARAASLFRPGDVLPEGADVSPELKDAQTTLPGRSMTLPTSPGIMDISGGAQRGAPAAPPPQPAPGIMVPGQSFGTSPTGQDVYRGTVKQRDEAEADARFDAFVNNPDIPDSIRRYVGAQRATGDKTLPYQLFEGAQTKAIVRVSPDKTKLQLFKGGQWVPVGAEGVPKDAQLLMEPQPGEGDSKPYFVPLQSAQGILSFDSRTGTIVGRLADTKLGESAQTAISNAQTILGMIGNISRTLTPDKLGPLMGRYKSVEQAILGGDTAFATLASQISTLQNTVINLRTGAAMSEKEAARILNELPDVSLPPTTFMARLNNARQYYTDWMTNRAAVGLGRPGAIPGAAEPPPTLPMRGGAAPTPTPTGDPAARARQLIEDARNRRGR